MQAIYEGMAKMVKDDEVTGRAIGGKARAEKLSRERMSEIGRAGSTARWGDPGQARPNLLGDTEMTMDQLIHAAADSLPVVSKAVGAPIYIEGQEGCVEYRGRTIRRRMHEDEWWFSIVDVAGAISESVNPRSYWSQLKKRIVAESGDTQLLTEIQQLPLMAEDGRLRETDCATTETLFRIIQSIPSKHAEPFKRWLARTAYERLLEQQNPEIAIKRAVASYELQGRDNEWIMRRLKSIVTRKQLTDEWNNRGVTDGFQYAVLTNEISRGTFGVTAQGHREVKGLKKRHDLRDHMTGLELLFNMLGEESAKQITVKRDAQGFNQNREAAIAGGKIAGDAREQLEKQLGEPVLSSQNFLPPSRKAKIIPPSTLNEYDDEDQPID